MARFVGMEPGSASPSGARVDQPCEPPARRENDPSHVLIKDIIDPMDTRSLRCRFAELATPGTDKQGRGGVYSTFVASVSW